jgi:hypothetical protein
MITLAEIKDYYRFMGVDVVRSTVPSTGYLLRPLGWANKHDDAPGFGEASDYEPIRSVLQNNWFHSIFVVAA